MALLALVAGQDVEPAEGSDGTDGRWRIARKVAEDRVISTVDPEARHTRKSREARRDGYRAHVAADPETGIITDEQLTRAAGEENSDAAVGRGVRGRLRSPGSGAGVPRWYGDSAYGTGDLRAAIAEAGHTRGDQARAAASPRSRAGSPSMTSPSMRTPGTVTCPAGVTRRITARRPSPSARPAATARCAPGAPPPKTGRTLHLHPHDALLRAARADWAAQPALREDYRHYRPNVERAISQVATAAGGASSSATAARPGTTPGSSAAPPPSTCATSSAAA